MAEDIQSQDPAHSDMPIKLRDLGLFAGLELGTPSSHAGIGRDWMKASGREYTSEPMVSLCNDPGERCEPKLKE